MIIRIALALAALSIAPTSPSAFAQLASPNASGVSIGHVHINTTDIDAQAHFWTILGGKIVQRDKLTMAEFPCIYVILRKQDPTGGTVGTVLNHFGFYVKDFNASVARWKAAGVNW